MDSRASTRTRLSVLPVFVALLLNIFMVGPLATAPSTTLALTGSSFDATDGNLAVDGAETDWCTDPRNGRPQERPPDGPERRLLRRGREGGRSQSPGRDGFHPEQQGRPESGLRRWRDQRRWRPVRLRRLGPQRRQRHRHDQLRAEPVRHRPQQRRQPSAHRRRPAHHLRLRWWRLRVARGQHVDRKRVGDRRSTSSPPASARARSTRPTSPTASPA